MEEKQVQKSTDKKTAQEYLKNTLPDVFKELSKFENIECLILSARVWNPDEKKFQNIKFITGEPSSIARGINRMLDDEMIVACAKFAIEQPQICEIMDMSQTQKDF